eukprot:5783431-Alexandrium_andersonii.AAC.1
MQFSVQPPVNQPPMHSLPSAHIALQNQGTMPPHAAPQHHACAVITGLPSSSTSTWTQPPTMPQPLA